MDLEKRLRGQAARQQWLLYPWGHGKGIVTFTISLECNDRLIELQ